MTKYPKDTLDVIVLNDAWQIQVKFTLPWVVLVSYQYRRWFGVGYGFVAQEKKQKQADFMITDGKPTCLREDYSVL